MSSSTYTEQDVTIDGKTRIPLTLIITISSSVVGMTIWLMTLSAIAHTAKQKNEEQDVKLERIYRMETDLAVIRTIIEEGRRKK